MTSQNGVFIRIPHELYANNIIVAQAISDHIDLDKAFKQRHEAQRDDSAKRLKEQQINLFLSNTRLTSLSSFRYLYILLQRFATNEENQTFDTTPLLFSQY